MSGEPCHDVNDDIDEIQPVFKSASTCTTTMTTKHEGPSIPPTRLIKKRRGAVRCARKTVPIYMSTCAQSSIKNQATVSVSPSSSSEDEKTFECCVCLTDSIPCSKSFSKAIDCEHELCKGCAVQFIKMIVSSGIKQFPIRCPLRPICKKVFKMSSFLRLLFTEGETETYEKLQILIIEKEAFGERMVYCANSSCSTPFDWNGTGIKIYCPLCRKQTCMECRTLWHTGKTCIEAQLFSELGAGLRALIRRHNWKTCPACFKVIEKASGCNHMTCTCGARFCYRCGMRRHNKTGPTCTCETVSNM